MVSRFRFKTGRKAITGRLVGAGTIVVVLWLAAKLAIQALTSPELNIDKDPAALPLGYYLTRLVDMVLTEDWSRILCLIWLFVMAGLFSRLYCRLRVPVGHFRHLVTAVLFVGFLQAVFHTLAWLSWWRSADLVRVPLAALVATIAYGVFRSIASGRGEAHSVQLKVNGDTAVSVPEIWVPLLMLGPFLLVLLTQSISQTGWDFDSYFYHIPQSQWIFQEGRADTLTTFTGYTGWYPANTKFLYGLFTSIGFPGFTNVLHLLHLCLCSLALYHIALLIGFSGLSAVFLAIVPWSVPDIWTESRMIGEDATVAAWMLSGLALVLAWCRKPGSWLFLPLGLTLGNAIGVKYTALGPVACMLGVIGVTYVSPRLRSRVSRGPILLILSIVGLGSGILLTGSFWYIRNFAFTGNPVYPFQVTLWGRVLFDGISSVMLQDHVSGEAANISWWFTRVGGSLLGPIHAATFLPGLVLFLPGLLLWSAGKSRVRPVLLIISLGVGAVDLVFWWFYSERAIRMMIMTISLWPLLWLPWVEVCLARYRKCTIAFLIVITGLVFLRLAITPEVDENVQRVLLGEGDMDTIYQLPDFVNTLPAGTGIIYAGRYGRYLYAPYLTHCYGKDFRHRVYEDYKIEWTGEIDLERMRLNRIEYYFFVDDPDEAPPDYLENSPYLEKVFSGVPASSASKNFSWYGREHWYKFIAAPATPRTRDEIIIPFDKLISMKNIQTEAGAVAHLVDRDDGTEWHGLVLNGSIDVHFDPSRVWGVRIDWGEPPELAYSLFYEKKKQWSKFATCQKTLGNTSSSFWIRSLPPRTRAIRIQFHPSADSLPHPVHVREIRVYHLPWRDVVWMPAVLAWTLLVSLVLLNTRRMA